MTDTPTTHIPWYLSLPCLLFICSLFVVGLSPWMPLFDLDEGAFTEATREMLASGNWVSTYLNGEPRHDKPILIYWLQAVSVSVFGFHEFALRLPSILCSFAWLFVIYRFCQEFWSVRVARTAVLMMATAWLALPIFKAAIADALLNWLLTLAFFDIYRFTQDPRQSRLFRLGLIMGLGFLTKGPVAVVLPLGTFFFALAYKRELGLWFKAVLHPASWLTFLLIITPWHVAVYMDQGWGFFEGFYLGHNIGRFSQTMEKHGGFVLYYVLLLPLLLMPFTKQLFMLPSFLKSYLSPKKPSLMYSFLILWFFITLGIFSFSQTQLPHYILYGLTPLFICIAVKLNQGGTLIDWVDIVLALIGIAIFALIPFLLPYAQPYIKHGYDFALVGRVSELFLGGYVWVSLSLLVLSGLSVVILTQPKDKLLVLSIAMAAIVNFMLIPLMAEGQQRPVKEAAAIAAAEMAKEENSRSSLVAYKVNMPSFSVYTQRIVTKAKPRAGDIIFTRVHAVEDIQQFDPTIRLEELYNKGGIILIRYGTLH